MVLGAGFIGDSLGYPMDELGIPCRRQADCLGKYGGQAGAGDAVEALVPPIVPGDIQSFNGRGIVDHLRDFFFQGHPGDQVIKPLLERQAGIFIRREPRTGLLFGAADKTDGKSSYHDQKKQNHLFFPASHPTLLLLFSLGRRLFLKTLILTE
jgi:hypothetical protein